MGWEIRRNVSRILEILKKIRRYNVNIKNFKSLKNDFFFVFLRKDSVLGFLF